MKESEAREKWCPFTRVSEAQENYEGNVVGSCSVNRRYNGSISLDSHCIASSCMAWRWNKGTVVGSLKTPRASGCPKPKGHCGLAGAK